MKNAKFTGELLIFVGSKREVSRVLFLLFKYKHRGTLKFAFVYHNKRNENDKNTKQKGTRNTSKIKLQLE